MGQRCAIALFTLLLVSSVFAGCASPPEGTVEWYFDRAYKLASKGYYDEAIEKYTNAIDLDPNLAKAYVNRAAAYASKEQYDLAIADCIRAIELDPDLALAYINRA